MSEATEETNPLLADLLGKFGYENAKCIGTNVLCIRAQRPKEQISSGGIVVPAPAGTDKKDAWPFFLVLAVGPDGPPDGSGGKVEPGDTIIFQQALMVNLGAGVQLHLCPANQVMMVVQKGSASHS
jgi:co-chaperonin GroES (HSP10)